MKPTHGRLKERGWTLCHPPPSSPDGFSWEDVGSGRKSRICRCSRPPRAGRSQDTAGAGDGRALLQLLLELLLLCRQHLQPLLQLAQLGRPLLQAPRSQRSTWGTPGAGPLRPQLNRWRRAWGGGGGGRGRYSRPRGATQAPRGGSPVPGRDASPGEPALGLEGSRLRRGLPASQSPG